MREQFGKWLMDIAKYITTAIVISSVFENLGEWNWATYSLTIAAVVATLVLGLIMQRKKKE